MNKCEFCEIDGLGNHAPRCPIELERQLEEEKQTCRLLTEHVKNAEQRGVEKGLEEAKERHNKDIQELNDRLIDFGKSHLAASKRDLDKYRELERKYNQIKLFIHQIDLSPCDGGSCMVATDIGNQIQIMKSLHKL